MTERCCGVFPINTGIRVLCISHILMSILLISDPSSTPFMRANIYCEDYNSIYASRVWIPLKYSYSNALDISDLVLGIAGCCFSSLLMVKIESRVYLTIVYVYFVLFACLRAFWALYLGYSTEAGQVVISFWGINPGESDWAIADACVSRLKRSALVDAVTTFCIYFYFSLVIRKKLRVRDRTVEPQAVPASEELTEGNVVSSEELGLLDLNVLGMNGRFFVGKAINQTVLGRVGF
jgi:hypothetical protein